MICAWVTWARRGLGRGELFRGFFVSPNPITQGEVKHLAGSKTLRHATVRGLKAIKKRGVGMVVGAPGVRVYTHTSDGAGWSSGDEGPSLKPDLNPSQPEPSTRIRTVAAGSLDLFD